LDVSKFIPHVLQTYSTIKNAKTKKAHSSEAKRNGNKSI
jgi:hypothetical protein